MNLIMTGLGLSLRAQRGNPRLPDFLDCHVATFFAITHAFFYSHLFGLNEIVLMIAS